MTTKRTCPRCGGAQYDPEYTVEVSCFRCGGVGDFGPSSLSYAEGAVDYCPSCGGRGSYLQPDACHVCRGYGEVEAEVSPQ